MSITKTYGVCRLHYSASDCLQKEQRPVLSLTATDHAESMIIRSSPTLAAEFLSSSSICSRCLRRFAPPSRVRAIISRANFSTTSPVTDGISLVRTTKTSLSRTDYFLANSHIGGGEKPPRPGVLCHTAISSVKPSAAEAEQDAPSPPQRTVLSSRDAEPPDLALSPNEFPELPHRRAQRLRQEAASVHSPPTTNPDNPPIPYDASSVLSTVSARLPPLSLRRLLTTYLSLSKPRLTFLIVLTTTTAYSLFPVPALLLPTSTAAPSLSTLTLLFLTTGTTLSSASANALNMIFESNHDARMSRTRNRPLVRRLISPTGAYLFAFGSGLVGLSALYFGVNPTVAFLSAINLFLYAGVYTPLKRIHPINTWVGAVVGGIPPLMGWAAAAGQSATSSGGWSELLFSTDSAGGWLLAGLLFAWQFPHFNALSWSIRDEYRVAGYKMMAWINPARNGRVALRYAILCIPCCIGLWWVGVTDRGFLITSGLANAWLVREAWYFWRRGGGGGRARRLFWASVWHLPVVMVAAMLQKRGLWDGVYERMMAGGEISPPAEEEDDDDDDDDDDAEDSDNDSDLESDSDKNEDHLNPNTPQQSSPDFNSSKARDAISRPAISTITRTA